MSKAIENEEISLKELILTIKDYFFELLRYWWVFIILGPLFGALMFWKESQEPITYTSELTFMMDAESGPSLGAVTGLLTSFGIGGGDNNVDKMLRLMKSRAIIRESLFEKVKINGKVDYFANHIMELEEIEIFEDEEETIRFYFKNADFGRYDRIPNEALMTLHKFIVGGEDSAGAMGIAKDELSGIITMRVTFLNEEIAVEYPNYLFDIVEEYFIEKTVEKSERTYGILESKYDSIVGLMATKEYQLAQEYDQGKNLIRMTKQIDRARLEKDIRFLAEQFAEIAKNKELAEFSLLSVTPVIQSVDLPIFPLKPDEPRKIFALGIGGILGGFLAAFLIIVRKLYQDTMGSGKEEVMD